MLASLLFFVLYTAMIMVQSATVVSAASVSTIGCEFVSSANIVTGRTCSTSGECETVITTGAIIHPGEYKCITVNRKMITIGHAHSVAHLTTVPGGVTRCRPNVAGQVLRTSTDADFTEGLGSKWTSAKENNGVYMFDACRGRSNGMTICHSHTGNPLVIGKVQKCDSDCAFAWVKSCSSFCGASHRHWVAAFCPRGDWYDVRPATYGEFVHTPRITVDGVSHDGGSFANVTAKLTGSLSNPWSGMTLLTNPFGQWVRSQPVAIGDCKDVCASVMDNSTGRFNMVGDCFSMSGTCNGVATTTVTSSVMLYSMAGAAFALPMDDAAGTTRAEVGRVTSKHTGALSVQVVISGLAVQGAFGTHSECDMSGRVISYREHKCPEEDTISVQAPCIPAVMSVDCSVTYISSMGDTHYYSLGNPARRNECMIELISGRNAEPYSVPIRVRDCITTPVTHVSWAQVRSGADTKMSLGGIIGAVLAGVVALAGIGFGIAMCVKCGLLALLIACIPRLASCLTGSAQRVARTPTAPRATPGFLDSTLADGSVNPLAGSHSSNTFYFNMSYCGSQAPSMSRETRSDLSCFAGAGPDAPADERAN